MAAGRSEQKRALAKVVVLRCDREAVRARVLPDFVVAV